MHLCSILVICLVIPARLTQENDEYLRFPEGFTIGAGGAAYQIEGGWNASGIYFKRECISLKLPFRQNKGESVWDRFVHTQPWKITNGSNGDIACDSYHKYKEDVQLIKGIGLDHYRFSISWTRVLPNGFANFTSRDGLRYYHNLIDELLASNVEPVALLYHWDHPQVLEDLGGWINELMVTWFADYANVIFREFGSKVKVFTTINEPKVFCYLSYVIGAHAPGKISNTSAAYLCAHNALKAHARAYHLYDQEYRSTQNGKIGIAVLCGSFMPKSINETSAADMAFQFDCGWIPHPIFRGDYPEIFKTKMAEISRADGLGKSIVPEFSLEWIEYIKNTSDYFGLNHYSSLLVEMGPFTDTKRSSYFLRGVGVRLSEDSTWESGSSNWLQIVPEGLGELLRRLKKHYNNPPVYIFENGWSDDGTLNDYQRIKYHHLYLKELLLAVNRDGCNVQKYTVWSFMNNFEWTQGYSRETFGLFDVNFTSPNRERTPKLSVSWLRNVMQTRRLQPPILPPL